MWYQRKQRHVKRKKQICWNAHLPRNCRQSKRNKNDMSGTRSRCPGSVQVFTVDRALSACRTENSYHARLDLSLAFLILSLRTYNGAGRRENRQINESSGQRGHGSSREPEKLHGHFHILIHEPTMLEWRLLVIAHEGEGSAFVCASGTADGLPHYDAPLTVYSNFRPKILCL